MSVFATGRGASAINPNRKIFEARKRETAALGAGEKLVLEDILNLVEIGE